MPRVGFVLPIPVKKVRKERTKVENAVSRKIMLLQTRTGNEREKMMKFKINWAQVFRRNRGLAML